MIRKYLTRQNIIIIVSLVLAMYMVGVCFIRYPYVTDQGPSWTGLDISWQMTLNYAWIKDLVWGKDIIYTYGPLGFLGTRTGWGISRWTFLCLDVFIVFNMFYMFKDFITDAADKWLAVLIIVVCLLTVEPYHRANITWLLMVSSFYWMYKSYKEPRFIYLLWSCINITLCFYLKLNAGLAGGFLMVGCLINLWACQKIKLTTAGLVLLALVCMVLLGSWCFNVSLSGYITGASEIVKGYNDSMSIVDNNTAHLYGNVTWLFILLTGFFLVFIIALIYKQYYSQVFFVCLCFAYMFLLRKQAITRNDMVHYFEFYSYIPLVLLSGNFLRPFIAKQKAILFFMLLVSLLSLFYTSERPYRDINSAIENKFVHPYQYADEFLNYDPAAFLHNKDKRYIPQRILSRVGKSSIDIFPWDTEYLLEHHLNYTPRPVFQSFVAYTAYLQNVNYNFYKDHAPEYVIYDFETVDGRYTFNDDLPVNFFLAKNYVTADTFTSNGRWRLLLQKKKDPQPLIWEEAPARDTFKPGQEIPIAWTWVKALKIDLEYNTAGRIESILTRAPAVFVEMRRTNGAWIRFRTSPEMLKAGIMVDRWVNDNHDFGRYIQDRDLLDPFAFVRIVVSEPKLFENKFKVRYYNVK